MTVILGISASHNGSVALIKNGEVLTAIQGERLTRRKRQSLRLEEGSSVASACVKYCLGAAGLSSSDINSVAVASPWRVKKISDQKIFEFTGITPESYLGTFYVPHHFSHMEYILNYGNNEPGIVLVLDGSGSREEDRNLFDISEVRHPGMIDLVHFAGKEVISAYWFDGLSSSLIYRFSPSCAPLEEYNLDSDLRLQSIGHYWEWASQYCFSSGNEAGKVMGLAGYGANLEEHSKPNLLIGADGVLELDYQGLKSYFKEPNVLNLDLSNSPHHQQIAQKVQVETENFIMDLLTILKDKFPSETLYLSGGVALNVVSNESIIGSKIFKKVVLNGSVEDNGTAIGAALAANIHLGYEKKSASVTDFYGKVYEYKQIIEAVERYDFSYETLTQEQVTPIAAELILDCQILGWFQGKSEFGPRALGNRSILANPCSKETKYLLDHHMKCRDRYRPYAPVVTEELAGKYFDMQSLSSPVMMRNCKVLTDIFPAITHIDGTARVQTVSNKENSSLHGLLMEVKEKTGHPVLLNTSFNLPGEPIVETPADAMSCFARGSLDFLFIGNVLVKRF